MILALSSVYQDGYKMIFLKKLYHSFQASSL